MPLAHVTVAFACGLCAKAAYETEVCTALAFDMVAAISLDPISARFWKEHMFLPFRLRHCTWDIP
jgi:hypothetical protein